MPEVPTIKAFRRELKRQEGSDPRKALIETVKALPGAQDALRALRQVQLDAFLRQVSSGAWPAGVPKMARIYE